MWVAADFVAWLVSGATAGAHGHMGAVSMQLSERFQVPRDLTEATLSGALVSIFTVRFPGKRSIEFAQSHGCMQATRESCEIQVLVALYLFFAEFTAANRVEGCMRSS